MSRIINLFILFISKTHSKILTLNDIYGLSITDKWLHFLIIGIFGFCMLAVVQPVFKWLEKNDAIVFISFIYVFTVVLVVTFAIEIGQAYSGTGDMDKYDIASGIAGFFVFFGLYLILYYIYKLKNSDINEIENTEEKNETKKKVK